jgi:hypothetical protein
MSVLATTPLLPIFHNVKFLLKITRYINYGLKPLPAFLKQKGGVQPQKSGETLGVQAKGGLREEVMRWI